MAYFLQRVENEPAAPRPGRIMAGRPPPAPSPVITCEGSSPSRDGNPASPLSRLVKEGYIGAPTAPHQQVARGRLSAGQGVDSLEQVRAGYQQQNDPNYSEKLTSVHYKNAPGGRSSLSLGWDDSSGSVAEPLRRGRGAGCWAPPQRNVVGSSPWQLEENSDMPGDLTPGLSPHRGSGSGSRPAHRAPSPGAFGTGVAGARSSSRDAGGMASILGGGAVTYQSNRAGRRAASPASGSAVEAANAKYRDKVVSLGGMGVCIGNDAYKSRAPPVHYSGCGGLPGMGR